MSPSSPPCSPTNPWLSVPLSHPCLAHAPDPVPGHWGPWPSWASHPPPSLSGIYKGFCLDVIRNKYECELQGAKQHLEVTAVGTGGGGLKWPARPSQLSCSHFFQSEKLLLYDTLQGELQERIQRLEEDRQSLDISSGEARAGRAPQPRARLRQLSAPAWTLASLPAQGAGEGVAVETA